MSDQLSQLAELDATRARREASTIDPGRVAGTLALAEALLDAPVPGRIERVLGRSGLPDPVVRTLVATPALRRSWFLAMAVALLFGLGAVDEARTAQSLSLFLALAPVVPVLGVALAYGPGVDPAYEVTMATPMSGFRLVLLRAVAVLGTSIPVGLIASLLTRTGDPMAFAWLLPALSLSAVCLAIASRVAPRLAGGIVAGGWLALVGVVNLLSSDDLVVFRAPGQVLALVVGLAAVALLGASRERFEQAVAPW